MDLEFKSIAEMTAWMQNKKKELGSKFSFPNKKQQELASLVAFRDWLSAFFEAGNSVTVDGEDCDYWECYEAAE